MIMRAGVSCRKASAHLIRLAFLWQSRTWDQHAHCLSPCLSCTGCSSGPLQVRFVHCRFTAVPTAPALECQESGEVEAQGCLFERVQQVGKTEQSRLPAPELVTRAAVVAKSGNFSAKHCVWRGLPGAVMVFAGKVVIEECLLSGKGVLDSTTPFILVSCLATPRV